MSTQNTNDTTDTTSEIQRRVELLVDEPGDVLDERIEELRRHGLLRQGGFRLPKWRRQPFRIAPQGRFVGRAPKRKLADLEMKRVQFPI